MNSTPYYHSIPFLTEQTVKHFRVIDSALSKKERRYALRTYRCAQPISITLLSLNLDENHYVDRSVLLILCHGHIYHVSGIAKQHVSTRMFLNTVSVAKVVTLNLRPLIKVWHLNGPLLWE